MTLAINICYFAPTRGPNWVRLSYMAKSKPLNKPVRVTVAKPKRGVARPISPVPTRTHKQVPPAKSTHAASEPTLGEPAPLPKPPAAALVLLERAMNALQQKDYRQAAGILSGILEHHASEGTLLDRVRVYLSLCEREMKRQPVAPRTIEERLTAATLALNNRLDDDAGRLAQSVLDEDADQDLARYLLASVAARRGRADDALRHLEEAIRLNPDARVQARLDDDFEALRLLDAFNTLIELPSHPALQRRGRRTR